MLDQIFSLVCGQNPAHTWTPGGEWLPFCQRCTGFFVGVAVALLVQVALRIRPSARFLQVHGLFLLAMVPLGLHWVAQGPVVRTLSGLLYGFGVVSFLWLFLGECLPGIRGQDARRLRLYSAGVGMSLVGVPVLAAWGGRGAAWVLTSTAVVGLAGLGVLVLSNLGIGIAWLVSRRRLSRLRPAP